MWSRQSMVVSLMVVRLSGGGVVPAAGSWGRWGCLAASAAPGSRVSWSVGCGGGPGLGAAQLVERLVEQGPASGLELQAVDRVEDGQPQVRGGVSAEQD